MDFSIDELKLPPIYKRQGKDCYLDPIRKKLIYITPEETVRQKIISYLIEVLHVPENMITVEDRLSHYGIDSKERADIIVNQLDAENRICPLAVIECKAPEVGLGEKEENQVLTYCDELQCEYAMLVNGVVCECVKFCEDLNDYRLIEELPTYQKMIDGEYKEMDIGELPPRIPFNNLKKNLIEEFNNIEDPHEASDISPMTDMSIAVPAFNLLEGLYDTRKKMKKGNYGLFKLLSDYGVRMLTYGNASGGSFYGPYRSFLIDVAGSTEFVSMSISTYFKSSNPDVVKTCLSVAIDNEKETHHSLQMVLDDNLKVEGKTCYFYHTGRIAIGNMGSGKISELREVVQENCPELILGDKFYLGKLVHDRLWSLDDPEVANLIANLIKYALLRDKYREQVKRRKGRT